MYYLTKFDDVKWSDFWVIPKIKSANVCKPIHDIINYSTFLCPFESRKLGKEGEKLQKFEYLENKKSFLDDIKNIFIVFEGLSFDEKIKILEKIADTSLERLIFSDFRQFLEKCCSISLKYFYTTCRLYWSPFLLTGVQDWTKLRSVQFNLVQRLVETGFKTLMIPD